MTSQSPPESPKPAEPHSENFVGVLNTPPRSARFKLVVGMIVALVAIVLITVATDFFTTGEVMKK
ncbi:hypothetical protein [Candidatus Lucifugimonas marina]|uniref:Uncharacterized protein n=1 Tax=Candidatus Lucifugimonas marina TaxID=3038979 RepID=A0AAJ5ZF89_9CHLR|nr:hypothetical protein [SAR202 cluster bacterium JH702]MDG0870245.1 hypothetical protein [SAR202 cluster bacterium JH639]WFG36192.1 hypothetical protein GKN94_10970 [SAR202 cluster bacterium JH545]WFG40138.1 hypothetical protein GKO48_11075 [SAR202 cluster bacterium JH1073]